MALPSTRYEYRLSLSNIDRGVQLETTLVAARHPSETSEHLVLRLIAWCVLTREGLVFGPGLSDGEGADLEARDPAGRVTCWVECGAVEAAKLRRVVQANGAAEIHVVLGDARRRRELDQGIAALPHGIKDASRVTLWQVASDLVEALARREERRQRWSATVVGGHLYVEADGEAVDGEVVAVPLSAGVR